MPIHPCTAIHPYKYIHPHTHIRPYTSNPYPSIHPCIHVKPQTMRCASMPIHAVPGVSENLCENFGSGMLSKVRSSLCVALVKTSWKLREQHVRRFTVQNQQLWSTCWPHVCSRSVHEVFTQVFTHLFMHSELLPFPGLWEAISV